VFIDDIGNLSVPSGSVTVSGSLTVTGSLTSPQIQPHSTTNPISLVTTGTVYFNSVIDELMYYDPERSKWLSVSVRTLQAGKNGRTQIGGFYRAIDKMTLNATDRGIPVPQGTLTGLGISKTDSFTSTVEVVVNGAVVTSLLHSTSGAIFNSNLNADFGSGSMSFRNASVGAVTDNVQVYAEFKRRI
jgi:hypothetical protein